MTVFQKSTWGYVIGGGLGAIFSIAMANKCMKGSKVGNAALGALLFGMIIGAINDKRLECDPNYTGGS